MKVNLVKHIEEVCVKTHKSELKDEAIAKAASNLRSIKSFFGLTDLEAVLFCIMFNLNFKNQTVCIDDIARFVGCQNPISVYKYKPQLLSLVEKQLVKSYKEKSKHSHQKPKPYDLMECIINPDVEKAIWHDKKFVPKSVQNTQLTDVWDLLNSINDMLTEFVEGEISKPDVMKDVFALLNNSEHLPFVSAVRQFVLDDESLFLLLICVSEHFTENEIALSRIITGIYRDDYRMQLKTRKMFLSGNHPLQKQNLVQLDEAEFRADFVAGLTDKTLDLISPGDSRFLTKSKKTSNSLYNIIPANKITPQTLFFNEQLQHELDNLQRSLIPENFKVIMKRMEAMSMNKVMTILFYGESGCGKTAYIKNLCAGTRDLWIVNTSETKNQYFGNSEKLIKRVFDDYLRVVDKVDVVPVLLFNEADGIMSSRQSSNRSTAISKTENAIASIILQALEDINNGAIIAATTNFPELMMNEDDAFALSRRFTTKVRFEMPSLQAKKSIWKERFTRLSNETPYQEREIESLAELPISPGEIDNVVRKIICQQVLTGEMPSYSEVREYCNEEHIKKAGHRNAIGFKI